MNEQKPGNIELESAIAHLYRGPLDDFIRRRDALAKEVRAAGNREAAAAVKNLRKPSRIAWALNQIALDDREATAALDAALSETVKAHGTGGDVRSAITRVRSAAREFADQATRAAENAGVQLESSVLANAIFAVLGTPESLDQFRRGVLADVPEGGGVDFLASLPMAPAVASPVASTKPRRAATARKVILQEFVTLDGFVADSKDSVDFIPAATAGDEALGQRQLRFMDSIDTILLGRVTYQMFADYWPNVTSGEDKAFADKLNAIPKIVFSKTLKHAPWGDWEDASVVSKNVAEEVARLKQESGKNIVIWGSISIAQALTNRDLIDEFQLIVCPVFLGKGKHLLRAPIDSRELKLRSSQSFDRGTVLLAYAAERRISLTP